MSQDKWLQHLKGLIPLDHIRDIANLPDDAPQLAEYQQAIWLAHGILRSLHIEPEFKTVVNFTNDQGKHGWVQVLDVGCGSAMKARFMLENGAATVTGIDHDPEELALAYQLPNEWGESLRFIEADVLEPLAFPDAHFDRVLICDGHIDFYAVDVFDELLRITKPGEQLILMTTNLLPPVRYSQDRTFASRIEAARWKSLADTTYSELVAAGESYEARFLRICHQFGFEIRHVPVQRQNPVPPAFELLIQQTFACFEAHILRDSLSTDDWQRLCDLHDPHSEKYLFQQPEALFLDMLTVATKTR